MIDERLLDSETRAEIDENFSRTLKMIDKKGLPDIPDDIEDGAVPTYDATEEKVAWKAQEEWLNIPDGTEDGAVPTYDATEEKVGWQVPQGGGGGDIFMVKFTADESYQNITSDKTEEEIINAYQSGKMPVAKLSSSSVDEDHPSLGTIVNEITLTTFVTTWDDVNSPMVSFTGVMSDGLSMMSTYFIIMTADGIVCYTKQIDISN